MTINNDHGIDDIKSMLEEIKNNPEILESNDQLTKLLKGVIQIEKRHIYGLDKTSTSKRRDEIFNYLEKNMEDVD